MTLCNPMDCSPPGSSVHGILQARILEWIAMPFSRESSWLGDQTCVSCLLHWQTGSLPPAPPGKRPLGISNSGNQVDWWWPFPKYHLGVLLQKCFPDTLRHRTLWPSIFSNASRLPEKLGLVKPVKDKIVQLLSSVRLFVTPQTVTRQVSLSMGFSRQEHWSGLPCPSPEDLPYPGIEPGSPALRADSLPYFSPSQYISLSHWCPRASPSQPT